METEWSAQRQTIRQIVFNSFLYDVRSHITKTSTSCSTVLFTVAKKTLDLQACTPAVDNGMEIMSPHPSLGKLAWSEGSAANPKKLKRHLES